MFHILQLKFELNYTSKSRLGILAQQKRNKKKRDKLKSINLSLFLKLDVGNVLSSQEVALQVFSPLQVFTTVFGMGTGGLPAIGHQQTCRLLLPIILGFSYTLKIA